MNRKAKIFSVVLGVIVVFGIVLYSGSAELFQGRMFKSSNPLPAYNENRCYDSDGGKNHEEAGTIYGKLSRSDFGNKTDVCTTRTKVKEYYCDGKFIQSEEYNCENGCSKGACKKEQSVNSDNALDTMVIVDTDSYDITEQDVKDFFKLSEDLWLEPKTGITFNLSEILFISFNEECPKSFGDCDSFKFLNENFPYFDKNLPEYIVFLAKNDSVSGVNGAAGWISSYAFLDDNSEYYNSNDKYSFCSEFPVPNGDSYSVPIAFVDYGHKFGSCGYDGYGLEEKIISNVSNNGECKGQNGLVCISKNGYQMCPNLEDDFSAQNKFYFSAAGVVHELLHSYGQNGALDHFGTNVCKEAMGETMKELEDKGVSTLFDTLDQEYAVMCPNVWEKFKNSQQSCD